jgi:hypothetical protein
VLQHDGGREKGLRKQRLALGYCQRCALVSNTDKEEAVASDRLVTSYTLIRSLPTSDPEVYDPFIEALTLDTTGPPRATSNVESLMTLQCSTDKSRSAPDSGRERSPPRLGSLSKLDRVSDGSYPTTLLKDLECRLMGDHDDLSWLPAELPSWYSHMGSHWPSYQPLDRGQH